LPTGNALVCNLVIHCIRFSLKFLEIVLEIAIFQLLNHIFQILPLIHIIHPTYLEECLLSTSVIEYD